MPENTRDITLEEAKKLYNSSEEAKTFLLSKFTKDELEGKNIPTQEEFNKFFEENIFTLIDHSKTKFLYYFGNVSKIPTSRIRVNNTSGDWLFDYDYDQKHKHFYYSEYRVYNILINTFSLKGVNIQLLMKSMVDKYFNLNCVTPLICIKAYENKADDSACGGYYRKSLTLFMGQPNVGKSLIMYSKSQPHLA